MVVVLGRGKAERVELGVEMAAHAIGADQHQGAHGITRRLQDRGLGGRLALGGGGRLVAQLLLDADLRLAPVAVERGDEFAVRRHRPVGARPGRAFGVLDDGRLVVATWPKKSRHSAATEDGSRS